MYICFEISVVYLVTLRPRDWMQITTEFRFCLSHKSTVWKVSCAGTPKVLAASRKALIFSIHLKAILLSLIFLTMPGLMLLTSLKKLNRCKLIMLLLHNFLVFTGTTRFHPSELHRSCPYHPQH